MGHQWADVITDYTGIKWPRANPVAFTKDTDIMSC